MEMASRIELAALQRHKRQTYSIALLCLDDIMLSHAENSKLKVGNTFRCNLFILGKPLYLTDLVQNDNPPSTFVAGQKDGLCELMKTKR